MSGDPAHPANFGRLCSKGSALGETLSPRRAAAASDAAARRRSLAAVDWDTALDGVADGLARRSSTRDGPDAVAFYLSGPIADRGLLRRQQADERLSRLGQCRHQFAAVHGVLGRRPSPRLRRRHRARQLMRTSIRPTSSCWSARTRRGAIRCFISACWRPSASAAPSSSSSIRAAPRRAEDADLHPADRAGHGYRAVLRPACAPRRNARARHDLISTRHTTGFVEALARAPRDRARRRRDRPRRPGCRAPTSRDFFELVPQRPSASSPASRRASINRRQGTDKVNAIINVHLATGRIGRPGMGPFSLTGQPNAMGGREVGGLANQLAAHMDFSACRRRSRRRRFWRAPRIARSRASRRSTCSRPIERGEIKALWVMATNPAVSLPRAGAVRAALKKLDLFVVVSENVVAPTPSKPARILLAGRRLGREGRHRHQFGTAHLAPARRSCRRPARRSRIGGSSRRWRKRLGFGEAFAYAAGGYISRACRAVGLREQRRARLRHRRAGRAEQRRITMGSSRSSGRSAPARRKPRAASLPTAASSRRITRRA